MILSTIVTIALPMDNPTDDQSPWDPNDCLAGTPTLLHRSLEGHTDFVSVVDSFNYNGCWYAVSGSQDTTIRVWDLSLFECVRELKGHSNIVLSLCCMPNDTDDDIVIVSSEGKLWGGGNDDFNIRVWLLSTGKCIKVLEGHSDSVRGVCFMSKNIIASCSQDKTVKIWDLKEGICIHTVDVDGGPLDSLVRLNDQYLVCVDSQKGTMGIIDVNSGECIKKIPVPHPEYQIFVQSIPDSKSQFVSWNGQFDVWNWQTAQPERSFWAHECMEEWGFDMMAPFRPNKVILSKNNGNLWVVDYLTEQKYGLDTALFGASYINVAGPWLVYAPIPLGDLKPTLRISPNPFDEYKKHLQRCH